jgi:hypothetical protein
MRVAANGQPATTTLIQVKSASAHNLRPFQQSFHNEPDEISPSNHRNRLLPNPLSLSTSEEKENETNPGKPDFAAIRVRLRSFAANSLILLLLLAVLISQSVAFAPAHSDDHAKHCCPVCHASHAPLLTAMPVVAFTPPAIRTCWRITPDPIPSLGDPWTSGTCTRGPPAPLSAA